MLRANFLLKFLKTKNNRSQKLVKYNSSQTIYLQDQINHKIMEIDQKISENNKALVEAQIVKLRSTFAISHNFFEKLGRNVYKNKLEESIYWHQKQVKELYNKRRELEINLEKLKGIFWLNQIKRIIRGIFIGFFILLSIFIFLSGFMVIIYLLPFIILIFLGYLISTKRF